MVQPVQGSGGASQSHSHVVACRHHTRCVSQRRYENGGTSKGDGIACGLLNSIPPHPHPTPPIHIPDQHPSAPCPHSGPRNEPQTILQASSHTDPDERPSRSLSAPHVPHTYPTRASHVCRFSPQCHVCRLARSGSLIPQPRGGDCPRRGTGYEGQPDCQRSGTGYAARPHPSAFPRDAVGVKTNARLRYSFARSPIKASDAWDLAGCSLHMGLHNVAQCAQCTVLHSVHSAAQCAHDSSRPHGMQWAGAYQAGCCASLVARTGSGTELRIGRLYWCVVLAPASRSIYYHLCGTCMCVCPAREPKACLSPCLLGGSTSSAGSSE